MTKQKELLYQQIANDLEHQISKSILKIGDKLPSLRTICVEKGVSLSTATQSYLELESRGLIESRSRSGYFVSYSHGQFKEVPSVTKPLKTSSSDDPQAVIDVLIKNASKAKVLLSSGVPSVALLPVAV